MLTTISNSVNPIKLDQPDNNTKNREFLVELSSDEEEERYTTFEQRLESFKNWPNLYISKEALARAGFVYTDHDDIVVCPVCKIEGYHWESGDDPMADHRLWNPNCSFVRNNVQEHDHSQNSSRTPDTCGLYGVEVLPNSVPEDDRNNKLNRLGIQRGKGPYHQDKITPESRLATFKNWPKSIKQRPSDLAEAGFFYTGTGDQTLCFYCNGGLKDWEESDDPWEQHALWFSTCVYLNLKKGKDFIKNVQKGAEPVAGPSGVQITKEEPSSTESLSDKCEKVKLTSESESAATEQTLCKICFKNELGVVFLPCGHIVACVDCATALKTCAVCRKPLEATVRAFLS